MIKRFKSLVIWSAGVLLLLPFSVGVTIMLTPGWRWLESTLGIEAIGHSGPAAWCYYSVFGSLFVVALGAAFRGRYRRTELGERDESRR